MEEDPDAAWRALQQAARGIVAGGLSGPYGHVSIRLDAHMFLVTPAKALSVLGEQDRGVRVSTEGELPPGAAGEVRVHQKIYARRPHCGAIVRFISPNVVALSSMGRVPIPRHGFGAYFSSRPGYHSSLALLRSDALAEDAVAAMGESSALVLRGNGAVVAGEDLKQALALAWFLEDAARVELEVLRVGTSHEGQLTAAECSERATWSGGVAERMWAHLTR